MERKYITVDSARVESIFDDGVEFKNNIKKNSSIEVYTFPEELVDACKKLKKTPNKSYMVVHVIGASEYWGPTVDANYFAEEELKKAHKTYETEGNNYINHVMSAGHFGKVLKSVYDDIMKRVLVLTEIDFNKFKDIKLPKSTVEKIKTALLNGEQVPISNGALPEYDECNICGNKRYKGSDPMCVHFKYSMGKILPDGRRVVMLNKNIKFDDLSFLTLAPADRSAITLKKVASADKENMRRHKAMEVLRESAKDTVCCYLRSIFSDINNYMQSFKDLYSMPEWLETLNEISEIGNTYYAREREVSRRDTYDYKKVEGLSKDLQKLIGALVLKILNEPEDHITLDMSALESFMDKNLSNSFMNMSPDNIAYNIQYKYHLWGNPIEGDPVYMNTKLSAKEKVLYEYITNNFNNIAFMWREIFPDTMSSARGGVGRWDKEKAMKLIDATGVLEDPLIQKKYGWFKEDKDSVES